jgi:hypothetical protein
MKVNLLNPQEQYPIVLLPDEIIYFYSTEIPFLELCEEANLVYPEKIERIQSLNPGSPSYINQMLVNLGVENTYRTLDEINSLGHDSQDIELENSDFYLDSKGFVLKNNDIGIGPKKLPKKPSFHKEIIVKSKINYAENLGILILCIFIAGIGFITIGGLFLRPISEFFEVSFLTTYLTLVLSSAIAYFIYDLIKNKDNIVTYHSEYKVEGLVKDRISKLNEYKNSVNQIFKLANQEIDKERKRVECLIENQKEIILKGILAKRLAKFDFKIEHKENTKRGKTELFFLQYLYEIFQKNVKIDVGPVMKKPFLPDFVIVYSDLGLFVDVEIDEPYVLETGEIIHHDRSRDSIRNQFFISNNWIVIRFSERQIVENPTECALFIKNVLVAIARREIFVETEIRPESTWTYEEVYLMKDRDERRNYLKNLKI